jgi:hypothetical protein
MPRGLFFVYLASERSSPNQSGLAPDNRVGPLLSFVDDELSEVGMNARKAWRRPGKQSFILGSAKAALISLFSTGRTNAYERRTGRPV